MNYSI